MTVPSQELDVDHLMSAIREAASKRFPNLAALSQEALGSAPLATQTNRQPRLNLSPEFVPRSDKTYHVNDLLKYQDRDFIRNAYRAILKREPDQAGFLHNLKLLQTGAFNKIDILASLRYSDEGKLGGVRIDGLRLPATIRTFERIPLLGYVFQVLIALIRLPAMIRSQREFQGYVVAQQLAIADHVNETQRIVSGNLEQHTSALDSLSRLPGELSNQQDQLSALEITVNQTLLTRIIEAQQKLQHAEAQLLLLSDRLTNTSQTLSQTRHELEEQHGVLDSLTTDVRTLARNLATEENRTLEELREWDNFYVAFEEEFRGSAEEVEERLKFYLPFVRALKPDSNILDIGSGRGDWLELLQKEGFHPRGVEINEVFADRSRQQGFEVSNTEMMVHLGQLPDSSLDLVTVFHLIEHFNVGKLIRLLDEIQRTLKPGGLLILETPSPENLVVAACNFYADPTHHKPIYPQTLMFLLSNKGFVDLDLRFLHSVDQSPFAGKIGGLAHLHTWFFGPRDFSVIARKAQ